MSVSEWSSPLREFRRWFPSASAFHNMERVAETDLGRSICDLARAGVDAEQAALKIEELFASGEAQISMDVDGQSLVVHLVKTADKWKAISGSTSYAEGSSAMQALARWQQRVCGRHIPFDLLDDNEIQTAFRTGQITVTYFD